MKLRNKKLTTSVEGFILQKILFSSEHSVADPEICKTTKSERFPSLDLLLDTLHELTYILVCHVIHKTMTVNIPTEFGRGDIK